MSPSSQGHENTEITGQQLVNTDKINAHTFCEEHKFITSGCAILFLAESKFELYLQVL